ncbi:molybdopterin-binding/glycosyltransferase family 2 protein [Prosthecomicrobium sp. N25]|uniref:molybdopterin-binding/glycosyltransferase family 2 protein n=1 Tax=Prosthecomicrobium sp. N25 TaxID=3129254 RepID=UPI003078A408
MRFGPVPVDEAAGAVLAHAVAAGGRTLRKGHVITPEDVGAFRAAGLDSVVAAVIGPDDLDEDTAAGRIAAALAGPHVTVEAPATGRSNLFAEVAGLLVVDREGIEALNALDPGITFATLPDHAPAEPGRMVATVKIIPFALSRMLVDQAVAAIRARGPLVRIAPFAPKTVAVVSTLLPSLKASVVDKTLRVMADRLKPAGARIVSDRRVPHAEAPLAEAIRAGIEEDRADLVVVFGASAVVDRQDVIPAAIERAGGTVDHFGMPVDPGNLLLVGRLGGRPVVGAPGCARSPRENGFDWILQRMLADLPVASRDIVGLGVGGLLMDIVSRPAPRAAPQEAEAPAERRIAAVVLAAGRSTRMGGPNKLLATIDGKPLVRRAAGAACGSRAASVTVVTGHMAEAVAAALEGLDVTIVHNPDYAEGLSTSMKAGIAAVPADAEAAVVLLGDMPQVTAAIVDRLIAAYDPARGALAVVATAEGRRGNPTLISRRFFPDLMAVSGDVGARQVLQGYPEAVVEVELGEAAGLDLDTPEALRRAGGTLV